MHPNETQTHTHTPNTHTETDRRESCSCHTLHVTCSPTRFLLDADCSAPAECIYLCLKAGEGGEATVAVVTAGWGQGARGCGEGIHGSRQNELTSRRVRGLISSIGLVACGYISVSAAAASLLLSTSFFPSTQHQPVFSPFVCKSAVQQIWGRHQFGCKLAVDLVPRSKKH